MIKTIVKSILLTLVGGSFLYSNSVQAQEDLDQLGAWYMYFWNATHKESPWGVQGDLQHRNFDLGGDLEQLMLRGGFTYKPKDPGIKFTAGYAHITSGTFGSSSNKTQESRLYQEALWPAQLCKRFHFTHRYRFEQRWVETQNFRTRYRYALFVNIPFNKKDLSPGAIYLALYDELFINGQRSIGDGRSVELFDRNRLYTGLGYSIASGLRTQLGFMEQTTDNQGKGQLQVSLHSTF